MPDNHQAAIAAIQSGDVDGLKNLLRQDPSLATARPDGARTLLHVATNWPGHFPNNVATVIALIESGADVNAPSMGGHSETPLHWAASSDDVAVLDTLLDHGADIEAPGAVIGAGTPLADAVAFGQLNAARRLVERGARANLWQAAGLGMMARVHEFFVSLDRPSADEVTNAFWCACAGGQRETAEYLLECGADPNWVGYNGRTPIDAAQQSNAGDLVEWLRGLGAETSSG